VSPEVWVSRCQTRIGSICGSVTGATKEPDRYTRVSANSGSHLEIGDFSSRRPSSYSIIAATDVIGLVIENIRTTVSSVNGSSPAMSRWPASRSARCLPWRLMAMCHPASLCWSM
jgi:hypothetical protein